MRKTGESRFIRWWGITIKPVGPAGRADCLQIGKVSALKLLFKGNVGAIITVIVQFDLAVPDFW